MVSRRVPQYQFWAAPAWRWVSTARPWPPTAKARYPPAKACAAAPSAGGEQIPVVGAGTSGSFAEIGSEKYQRLEVMAIFFNSGATVFDTSPNYGGADKVLGALLEEGDWQDQASWPPRSPPTAVPRPKQWATLKALRDKVELLQVSPARLEDPVLCPRAERAG